MKRKREWFDDDSFWIDMYPFMFPDKKFLEAEEQLGKLLKLIRPKGKDVLDLCCGPGRFAVPLAKRGFRVTGVDRTAFLLHKAKAKARAAKVRIEWVEQDMRTFLRPESFNVVLNLFTSFGYFENKDDDIWTLNNIRTNLKTGGVFLVDVIGKEQLAQIFQPITSTVFDDGTILVQRHEIFDDWTRIRNEWILIWKDTVKRYRFHHTIYSGQELRDRLHRAGFEDIRLYGNLSGAEYGTDAERLIAVARKK